jgi:diguanylate cyclase (GGDEF)-like protein
MAASPSTNVDLPPPRLREQAATISFGCAPASRAWTYQMQLVRQRLATLSFLLGVAVLAWIPIDLYVLPDTGATLAGGRAAAAALLLGLSWSCSRHARWRARPYLVLALFVLLQCAAFVAAGRLLPADTPPLLRLGYGLFPFVIGAELAIFPLPLTATALLSLPIFAVLLLPGTGAVFAPELTPVGGLWLLGLIVTVASWAGAAQLALLQGLLQARIDAAHDMLTGLANRRMALARLEAAVALAHRTQEPLTVLALDLDHFKRVNDRHGHASGDRCLIAFAEALRRELRAGDLGARMGGEEFIAILPATAASAAMHVAERIRAGVAALVVPDDGGQPIRFTISIGVAAVGADDDCARLLARADGALYEAKQSGRNRVSVAAT